MGNAMVDIEVGLKGTAEMIVERQDLASFSGNLGAEVLSTPRIVQLMEHAAWKALEGRLPEGRITVGSRIEIRHFAATPLGMRVRADATLREVDIRRLLFDVSASDEIEQISEGVLNRRSHQDRHPEKPYQTLRHSPTAPIIPHVVANLRDLLLSLVSYSGIPSLPEEKAIPCFRNILPKIKLLLIDAQAGPL